MWEYVPIDSLLIIICLIFSRLQDLLDDPRTQYMYKNFIDFNVNSYVAYRELCIDLMTMNLAKINLL